MNTHLDDHRNSQELDPMLSSFRMAMFGAAAVFSLVGLLVGWIALAQTTGNAAAIAALVIFVCSVLCALLLTFAVIIGKRLK